MDNKIKFDHALKVMQECEEFKTECVEQEFDDGEQRFIIASAIDINIKGHELCELVGITYNHRPHRRYKDNRDQDRHATANFLTVQNLTEDTDKATGKKLTAVERLDKIIEGNHRAADIMKAIELKEKIVDKATGGTHLQPFEKLWLEVIIPNMLDTQH